MKKAYTAPKKVAEEVKNAYQSACGRGWNTCGKLVARD